MIKSLNRRWEKPRPVKRGDRRWIEKLREEHTHFKIVSEGRNNLNACAIWKMLILYLIYIIYLTSVFLFCSVADWCFTAVHQLLLFCLEATNTLSSNPQEMLSLSHMEEIFFSVKEFQRLIDLLIQGTFISSDGKFMSDRFEAWCLVLSIIRN